MCCHWLINNSLRPSASTQRAAQEDPWSTLWFLKSKVMMASHLPNRVQTDKYAIRYHSSILIQSITGFQEDLYDSRGFYWSYGTQHKFRLLFYVQFSGNDETWALRNEDASITEHILTFRFQLPAECQSASFGNENATAGVIKFQWLFRVPMVECGGLIKCLSELQLRWGRMMTGWRGNKVSPTNSLSY